MNERLNCHCLLCLIEEKLCAELADPGSQESQRALLSSGPHLAAFPTARDLLSHLQSLNETASSDVLLGELLRAKTLFPAGAADTIFVLLFLPLLHSTVRRLRKRYPTLSREDTAQQAVGALLEYLDSPQLRARDTYLAFAIARKVRRTSFE